MASLDKEWYHSFCHFPLLSSQKRHHINSTSHSYDTRFIFWQDGDFGGCFEQFAILSLSYSLLSIMSGYYIGHTRLYVVRRKTPSLGLFIRFILTSTLFVNSLLQFLMSFWLIESQTYSLLLSQITSLIGWLSHSLSLLFLSLSPLHIGFGPLPLNLSWFCTLLSTILYTRTILRSLNDTSLSLQVPAYIQFSLQILYIFCLILPARKTTSLRFKKGRVVNISTQYKEEEAPLLEEDNEVLITSAQTLYGSINDRPRPSIRNFRLPDTMEDRANILSLLTFWWLQSLLKKGSQGLLQRPQDLPILPKSLSTLPIREKFQAILYNNNNNNNNNVRNGRSELFSNSLIEEQSLHSLNRLTLSQNNSLPPPPPSPSPPLTRVSLAKGLNKAFGLIYYPLGIVKLINDVIGFGGPLLLHALVSFMENKTEPISHGYYYALGLFLSTLLTAFLNAHFTYQVNKICVKVRAALVTEIFRKSLAVNSVEMSKFSIGQVVNYMSTDTDRIVNFCNSFHQFWSLPFQIAVSLYLLYRQVGLAFLAGLVFSILLIPINRWLAKKIGQLSTAMMSQKDSRVKLMTEILSGIRVIKFYAWERHFTDRVNTIRSSELKSLAGRKYLDALCVYFWATTPVLISILTFTTYVALGHKLTAAKVS